jgi:hypothetical protein
MWFGHVGCLERANEFVPAPRQADLLKVVIRWLKIDSALMYEHRDQQWCSHADAAYRKVNPKRKATKLNSGVSG